MPIRIDYSRMNIPGMVKQAVGLGTDNSPLITQEPSVAFGAASKGQSTQGTTSYGGTSPGGLNKI
jgi:hypothetical protein